MIERPDELLNGLTAKIKPDTMDHCIYVTVNFYEGKPVELFLRSDDVKIHQYLTFIAVFATELFRRGGATLVINHMLETFDPSGGYGFGDNFHPSVVAHIGKTIRKLVEL